MTVRGRAMGSDLQRAPVTEDVEWQIQGSCSQPGARRELWFPARDSQAGPAKRICLTCPVVIQCRDWALSHHEQAGVWGALSEGERQEIWKGRTIRRRYHPKTMADLGLA